MKIAVEGCCHGSLNAIYRRIGKSAELLLICGDFQSLRAKSDLQYINVPQKYKQLGDFHEYYNGSKKAPVLTIFIGGNHEDSRYLDQFKHGGFVAPNIFFLGRSNVVWYKGLRIGGMSGIYKQNDFMVPCPEAFDFLGNPSAVRKAYHVRMDDYFKLRLLKQDNKMIMLSHDWPEGIYNYGDKTILLKTKPWFKNDVKNCDLGNPYGMELLKHIRPSHWFSAHLHVKFKAEIKWNKRKNSNTSTEAKRPCQEASKQSEANMNEIELDLSSEDETCQLDVDEKPELTSSKFLALDKCLPKRQFIEFVDIPVQHSHISFKEKGLYYDEEFIAILKAYAKSKSLVEQLTSQELLVPPVALLESIQSDIDFEMQIINSLPMEAHKERFKISNSSFQKSLKDQNGVEVNPQTQNFVKTHLGS